MPFNDLESPSIGLTQMKTVLKKTYGNYVDVKI